MTASDLRRTMNLLEETTHPRFNDAFRLWFGTSKAVDRDGTPLVFYHGTQRDIRRFERRSESHDAGIFFTRNTEYAGGYATNFAQHTGREVPEGANIVPCYLRITNPFYTLTKPTDIELKLGSRGAFTDACIEYLEKQGYDSVVCSMTPYEVQQGYHSIADAEEACVFHPGQVKSAMNSGAFDLDNDDISESS